MTPGLTCRNAPRWSVSSRLLFSGSPRAAVSERIPALLTWDDYGSSAERDAAGQVYGGSTGEVPAVRSVSCVGAAGPEVLSLLGCGHSLSAPSGSPGVMR